jgi:hypothetical protein
VLVLPKRKERLTPFAQLSLEVSTLEHQMLQWKERLSRPKKSNGPKAGDIYLATANCQLSQKVAILGAGRCAAERARQQEKQTPIGKPSARAHTCSAA